MWLIRNKVKIVCLEIRDWEWGKSQRKDLFGCAVHWCAQKYISDPEAVLML